MRFLTLYSTLLILCFFTTKLNSQKELEVIIQTGHAGKINSLIYSHDNTKIYSAGKDAKIILWDVKTGKQETEIIAHKAAINKIEFYNDSTLISCSDDSTVKLIDARNLEILKTIGPFKNKCKAVAVNQKNHNVAIGTRFLHLMDSSFNIRTLKALSFDHYDAVHYLDEPGYIIYGGREDKFTRIIREDNLNIVKSITANATSIDSYMNEYVIGDLYGVVYYYNMRTMTEKRYCLPSPLIAVNDVGFFGNKILIARADGIVEEILKRDFTTYNYFKGHLSEVTSVCFGKDKNSFVSADIEGNIIVWDDETKKMTKLLKGEANPINVAKFSQDEDELLIGYSNGILRKINLISNNVISNRLYFPQEKKLKGWKYAIISLDEQVGNVLKFKALKTKPFEENTNQLSFCEIWVGEWDIKKNEIRLVREILKDKSNGLIVRQASGKQIVWQTYFLDENSKQTAALNDGDFFRVKNGHLETFNNSSGDVSKRVQTLHSDLITGVDYNKKYNVAITYSWDGSIRFWEGQDLNRIADLYLTGQRDFLWLNPQSYYFASKGALENVAFSWEGNVFPFDQFDVKYNRPDLIYEKLPFIEQSLVVEMNKAYQKRLKKLGITIEDIKISSDLPQLEVLPPEEQNTFTDNITFQCKATDPKEAIIDLKVIVNGVPLLEDAPELIEKKQEVNIAITVPLTPGDNFIEIFAVNAKGIKSLKESFVIESKLKERKPDLYLVTIGVSKYNMEKFNLNYASKDSKDVIHKFEKSKIYKNIYTKNLSDADATNARISTLTDFVKNAKYNDVVIIFAAGHGVLDDELDYYFASYDMDFYKPQERGISFESFEHILEATKSRKKLLLLDACHSGEVDKDEVAISENVVEDEDDITFRAVGNSVALKDGQSVSTFQLSKMLFADTRESNGATVISSASGTEYAIEGKEWNNGVFTYTLLDGLENKHADLNRDGEIMLSELQTYLNIRVIELTSGRQSPNSRVENLKSDFRIW
ncbi:MAG: caspase family protein [Crocinitomicaceae bacterium]|nr:caspase family protein [Crocinitomicaceae bacterium]